MGKGYAKLESVFKNILFIFFIILISGYILFPKSFSKLGIDFGFFTFYITEIFIFLSLILIIALVIINKSKVEKIYFFYPFLFFFLMFVLALSIGFYNYRDIVYVLRQSALFYYSLFYFIVFYLFSEMKKINYFIITILVCSNLLIIVFIARYIGLTTKLFGNLAQHMLGGGYYFPIAILLILEISLIDVVRNRFLKVLIFLDIFALIILSIFEDVRGNWLAIAIAIIISFIFSRKKKKFLINILIIVLVLVIIGTIGILFFSGFLENTMKFGNTINEIKSLKTFFTGDIGDTQSVEEANANWRTIAWKGYFGEILKRPIIGWGFGRKFLPSETFDMGWNTGLADNYVPTHNYLLSFLYMSGVIGLLIFCFIIIKFFIVNIKFLKNTGLTNERYIVSAFLSCIVYILVLGLMEVVLEIPYQGVLLWVFFAFNILIIKGFNGKKNEDIAGT